MVHNESIKTAVLQRQAARPAAQEQLLVDRARCLNDTEVIQDECPDEAEEN